MRELLAPRAVRLGGEVNVCVDCHAEYRLGSARISLQLPPAAREHLSRRCPRCRTLDRRAGVGAEADHVVALEVVSPIPPGWEPVATVPRTRSECPTTRPCAHLRCEWNLWLTDGRDRPGRRGPGRRLPRSALTLTPYRKNCGAEIADAVADGRLTAGDVAELVGISGKQLRRLIAKARDRLRAASEDELAELLAQATDYSRRTP